VKRQTEGKEREERGEARASNPFIQFCPSLTIMPHTPPSCNKRRVEREWRRRDEEKNLTDAAQRCETQFFF
jgi:hypothetical protein